MLNEPVTKGHSDARPIARDEAVLLREVADDPSIANAVQVVREFLEMDVAYMTTMTESSQTFEVLSGDGESFGIAERMVIDVESTYCQRVLTGRLPNLNPDVKGDPRTASLPITEAADVGAFVSIPLRLADGSIPGTLCAGSHRARPDLGYRDLQFLHVFARLISDQIDRRALESTQRGLAQAAAAAMTLIAAVTARDSYTGEHSRHVVANATAVAAAMGLSEAETSDVEMVALLHDIGKIGISDEILRKSGPLTDEEWVQMRRHPVVGEELVREVPDLQHLGPALRAEHERWDGGGYPDGIAGGEIPVASRITFVCDAYDAMTSDRPYRKALSVDVARAEIRKGLGTQFCPLAGAALLASLESA